MDRQHTIVRIGGMDYTLAGAASEEYMHRVAIYVDRKMEEITRNNPKLSTTMAAVLVSLNIADELLRLRDSLAEEAPEIPAPSASQAPAGTMQAGYVPVRNTQRLQQTPRKS